MSTFTLRIKRIHTKVLDHALRPDRIIRSHAGTHATSRFLAVMVEGEDGGFGFGEAPTTALWSGETAETAEWMVANVFTPLLLSRDFEHPREALELLDEAVYANPFAKSAIDTALWDLWARSQGVSAMRLFGDRQPLLEIPTRASVGAYSVEDTVRIATLFWQAGVRTLKFKIGIPGMDDAARLHAVRETLGSGPTFTVDANGAYQSVEEAATAVEKLLPFNIKVVEQPTHRDRIAQLAQVRRRLDVPIMADECIFTPQQLRDALEMDAFDILSIYPGKNGGVIRSVEMAQIAHRAGKTCAIGSNLETDLGQAAMLQLAAGLAAFPVTESVGDLGAALFYETSSLCRPTPLIDGKVKVPGGPGFGVMPLCFASACGEGRDEVE